MTVTAAEQIRQRDAYDARLGGLMSAVAMVEADHACLGPDAIPAQSLRQLVIAMAAAVGRTWLAVRHDESCVIAFTDLYAAPAPPALPVLDRILGDLLHCRFGHVWAGQLAG